MYFGDTPSSIDAFSKHPPVSVGASLNSGFEQMRKRDHDAALRFIPDIPKDYCFAYERFSSSTFCVDEFVLQNSKKVASLEVLREHLGGYLKIVKQSMIELIHEDYTEFINLSANLISFEKSIANLKTPLSDFKDETHLVHRQVTDRIDAILQKRARLIAIRQSKVRLALAKEVLRHFHRIEKNLEKLEQKLDSRSTQQHLPEEFTSEVGFIVSETEVLVRKFQKSFDCLCDEHTGSDHEKYLDDFKDQFKKLSERFFNCLETLLDILFGEDNFCDSNSLSECVIRVLLLNKRQGVLEKLITSGIVGRKFDEYITESYVSKNGCGAMLDNVLKTIQNECSVFIKSISRFDHESRFEIVVNSIWNEFVSRCCVRAVSLFSLVKADDFYSNYQATCQFCARFLAITGLEECRKQFEQLPSYHQLMSKFNLNVYFHMQLQQLVPVIEKNLVKHEFQHDAGRELKMNATQLIHDHIVEIWKDQHRSSDLFPYLWKITIKLIARFRSWILQTVTAERITDATKESTDRDGIVVRKIAILLSDIQSFTGKFQQYCDDKILPLWVEYFEQNNDRVGEKQSSLSVGSMKASIDATIRDFHSVTSQSLLQLIRNEILANAQTNLVLINDIPRLYRRTNKEKPTRASAYISKFFGDLGQIFTLMSGDAGAECWQKSWFGGVLGEVIVSYKDLAIELLTSVQKTEDSLKKLKKANLKPQLPSNSSLTMSDDDKIRLQIFLDVQQMILEVRNHLGIDLSTVPPYGELAQTVSSLKNLQ